MRIKVLIDGKTYDAEVMHLSSDDKDNPVIYAKIEGMGLDEAVDLFLELR